MEGFKKSLNKSIYSFIYEWLTHWKIQWYMKKSRENSEHYYWGNNCSGWHLLKSQDLSIIEECMPPKTQEIKHYHANSQQFFRILKGTATFEIENEIVEVKSGEGIQIPAKTKHRIRNDQLENLEFIVISQPTTRGDRYDLSDE